ncbi:protein kinase domain-containing protein [Clavibacter michiganensis]|uniref:protein kinase domain-containing protein n=1 Tax=Clavibacter michiganensis TaxID=28447 RepID=UPI00355C97A7
MQGARESGRGPREARTREGERPPARTRGGTRRRTGAGSVDDGSVLAGYRLVRLIGRGERTQVYLGRPTAPHGTSDGSSGNVAVKVVPASRRSRGDTEILALQAVDSEHVVHLLDVASLADGGVCLVQSLCARGTAAALVGRRGELTPGEVCTLLTSVLRGLGDLHQVGVAHGALDLTHVLLDATGRPILGGLGSAQLPGGAPGDEPAAGRHHGMDPMAEDLARVARMAAALWTPGRPTARSTDASWDDWLATLDDAVHGESDLTAHDLADRLLEIADAAPLADVASDGPGDDRGPVGGTAGSGDDPAVLVRRPEPERRGRRREPSTSRDASARARRHRAPQETPIRRTRARLRGAVATVRQEMALVRPRVWMGGAAALLVAASGAVAVPMLGAAAHGAPQAVVGPTMPSADPEADGGTTDAVPPDAAPLQPDVDAASSPDPDVAAPALLRLRADCLRSSQDGCLGGVDQPDSAMEDADRSRARTGSADAAALHATDRLDPAQRLGDSALITLHGDADAPGRRPASLLMVRGEAGWRIRDLMDDR